MIPLSTTTIAVHRLSAGSEYDEPYAGAEPHNRDVITTGVRAVIDTPSGINGNLQLSGGQQNLARYRLICDPTDIVYTDVIEDEQVGRHFRVQWLIHYPNDHVEAGLYDTEGEV